MSPSFSSLSTFVYSISILKTVKEALNLLSWYNVILEEINALDENHTWDLVDLPKGMKAVGCKWVFAVKVNLDSLMARLIAKLIVKEYTQTYKVDYFDTFSLMAKLISVHLFISIVAFQNWSLY